MLRNTSNYDQNKTEDLFTFGKVSISSADAYLDGWIPPSVDYFEGSVFPKSKNIFQNQKNAKMNVNYMFFHRRFIPAPNKDGG